MIKSWAINNNKLPVISFPLSHYPGHLPIISSEVKLNSLIASLDPLNERLTLLEDNFSYVLGEGSRRLENIILKILFGVALTVEITGLILTISVSRNITKALNASIHHHLLFHCGWL